MKNSLSSIKKKIISKYLLEVERQDRTKSSNINVLLNRVKLDKKRESRKKLLFSAVTSASVLIFGFLVF